MRLRVLPVAAGVLSLCSLLGCASSFAAFGRISLPAARNALAEKSGSIAARMVGAVPLDPLQLTQDKAMQTCALRPYRTKEDNNGLSTATFALG